MGDVEHIAVLHPFDPISYEFTSDVNPLIFKGYLMTNEKVEVLVTGGLPGADSFEVPNPQNWC